MPGHSMINVVPRYAHPTQEHQTEAMDKREQYVSEQKIVDAEQTAPQISYAVQIRVEQNREKRGARYIFSLRYRCAALAMIGAPDGS